MSFTANGTTVSHPGNSEKCSFYFELLPKLRATWARLTSAAGVWMVLWAGTTLVLRSRAFEARSDREASAGQPGDGSSATRSSISEAGRRDTSPDRTVEGNDGCRRPRVALGHVRIGDAAFVSRVHEHRRVASRSGHAAAVRNLRAILPRRLARCNRGAAVDRSVCAGAVRRGAGSARRVGFVQHLPLVGWQFAAHRRKLASRSQGVPGRDKTDARRQRAREEVGVAEKGRCPFLASEPGSWRGFR